jgi:hypothetical protein
MKPEKVISELMNRLFYGHILAGKGIPEVPGIFDKEACTV